MQTLVRMSMLRNVPIVFGERQIGLFHNACFDKTRKRVCALMISSGIRGKRIVPTEHICMIADRFILVDGWCRYRRSEEEQSSVFVRDASGLLVGYVSDYAMDPNTMEILAIEVHAGYWPKESRAGDWIYTYSFSQEDTVIIPTILRSRPCFSKEGNESCGCLR